MTDIEYNPEKCPYIVVSVVEYDGSTTTNTLYFVDPTTWAVVPQAGGALFTDHSGGGIGGFREIAWDCCGNLFIGTYVTDDRVNLRFVPNACDVGSITDDSSLVWNTQDDGQWTSSYSGMDIALGEAGDESWCCVGAGDFTGDGAVNGLDMQGFITCYLAFGDSSVPGPGCCCADVDHSGIVDSADIDAFVALLLN
jgi:hypothetical protein